MADFKVSSTLHSFIEQLSPGVAIAELPDGYKFRYLDPTTLQLIFQNGEYCIGSYERLDQPDFYFFTTDLNLAEKYVATFIGADYRSKNNLAEFDWIRWGQIPKPGYTIQHIGDSLYVLEHAKHGRIPARLKSYSELGRPTRFSHFAGEPLEDIIASFLDPQGRPLFEGEFLEYGDR